MPLIFLIRHGENDFIKKKRLAGRLSGIHLNDSGRSQAKSLAEMLAKAPIKAVYSSPLERTMETAKPIAEALGLQVKPRSGLIETDVGKWQGKKLKVLSRRKRWQVVQSSPCTMRFPGGESFAEAQHRICSDLESLCKKHNPKDLIICVSHADPIKLAVAFYLGLPLDLFQRLAISPASITTLYIGTNGSHLLSLNYNLAFNFPGH